MHPNSHLRYRKDIDGLRAIAVLLVFADHVGLRYVPGGFAGVDIFFVISGYLITNNIVRSMDQGTFTLLGFYERRARRILPALFALLALLSIAAWLILLPSDLINYANSAIAAIFSYSNIYFSSIHHTGYFSSSVSDLLIHTWSLGVEEQFYLCFPLLLLLFGSRKATRNVVLLIAALLSFAIATWLSLKAAHLSFYMPYTRAWELLCGSFAAFGYVRMPSSRNLREVLAIASLLTIGIFIVFYNFAIPFPGVTALPVCAAATCLLVLGEDKSLGGTAVLSFPPLVFIGLISYSFYLWHWPILLLARLGLLPGVHMDRTSKYLFLFALSFSAATLSWYFVERPFRSGRWGKISQRSLFINAGVGAVMLTAVALTLRSSHGWVSRFPADSLRVSSFSYQSIIDKLGEGTCFNDKSSIDFPHSSCIKPRSKLDILLIGDSHAAVLWQALQENIPDRHVLEAAIAGCPIVKKKSYGHSTCSQYNRYVFESALPAYPDNPVIFSHRWQHTDDLVAMQPALEWFAQHKTPVYVVGPGPEYAAPLPYLLALSIKFHSPAIPSRSLITSSDMDQQVHSKIANDPRIHYVSVWKALCSDQSCQEYADSTNATPLLIDTDHLSTEGSELLVQRLQAKGELPR